MATNHNTSTSSGRQQESQANHLPTIRRELKAACAKGREYLVTANAIGSFGISGGWTVRVEAVYNTPRGGPMPAWKYLYYLIPPNSRQRLGGYDRADSFCGWAAQKIQEAA